MVEIVKDNGVTTIAITNQSKSPLAELCDHVLLTATREHIFHDQVSFTRMAAMSVIDTLFLLLFSTKWDSFEECGTTRAVCCRRKIIKGDHNDE